MIVDSNTISIDRNRTVWTSWTAALSRRGGFWRASSVGVDLIALVTSCANSCLIVVGIAVGIYLHANFGVGVRVGSKTAFCAYSILECFAERIGVGSVWWDYQRDQLGIKDCPVCGWPATWRSWWAWWTWTWWTWWTWTRWAWRSGWPLTLIF